MPKAYIAEANDRDVREGAQVPVAPEKFHDWNAWISDIGNVEGLSEIEKREAMRSLSLLRELFGEDFLKRPLIEGIL